MAVAVFVGVGVSVMVAVGVSVAVGVAVGDGVLAAQALVSANRLQKMVRTNILFMGPTLLYVKKVPRTFSFELCLHLMQVRGIL